MQPYNCINVFQNILTYYYTRIEKAKQQLTHQTQGSLLIPIHLKLKNIRAQLTRNIIYSMNHTYQHFEHLKIRLHTCSPLQILNRGYSITQKCNGTPIKYSHDVTLKEEITIQLHQGQLHCQVQRINK